MKYYFSVIWITRFFTVFTMTNCQRNADVFIQEYRPKDFRLVIPKGYDGSMPPKKKGSPLLIDIKINPIKLVDIFHDPVTLRILAWFHVYWHDDRISLLYSSNTTKVTTFNLQHEETERLWLPILGLRNAMGDQILTPKYIKFFGWRLYFRVRKEALYHCDFDLRAFPLDTHKCSMEVQAYNYKSSVLLKSFTDVEEFEENTFPGEFLITDLHTGNCSRKDTLNNYYSCVKYGFTLRRKTGKYFLLTFLPSGMIVVFSWASFWLDDISITSPRVALGISTVLALTNQFIRAQQNLPKVSYFKAVDVWMSACMVMLFASLLEFLAVHEYHRITSQPLRHPLPIEMLEHYRPKLAWQSLTTPSTSPIDLAARRYFPLAFLTFNYIYWCYYCTRYST